MLNRAKIKTAAAGLLAVTMTASCPLAAYADSAKLCKNETVFVMTSADGEARKTIVSDRITGSDAVDSVKDVSELKNLEVVKGDSAFSRKGDSLTWTTGGSEISYRGTTDKETPVTMDVEYYLDGRRIEGSKLAGRSGDVRIVISYHNNTKPCVPFVCISGFAVTDGCLTDIKVDGGKVVEDEGRTLVCAIAAPGVGASLGSELSSRVDLRDRVTITAKAKNFSISEIMTVVSDNLTDEIDSSKLDMSIDVGDGTRKLKDGATDLKNGADELAEGTSSLKSGIDELSSSLLSSLNELGEGAAAISSAVGTSDSEGIRKGASELAAGAAGTKQAADAAAGAVKQSEAVLEAMKNENPDVDFSELEKSLAAAEVASQTTAGYAGAVSEGSKALQSGIVKLSGGVSQLCSGIQAASASNGKLSTGLGALSSGADAINKGQKKLSDGAGQLEDGIELADEMINDLADEFSGEINHVRGILNAGRSYDNFSGISDGMDGSVRFVFKTDLSGDK